MKRTIHTDEAPAALGPYSQAVLCEDTLYLSAQVAIDPAEGKWTKPSTVRHARSCVIWRPYSGLQA
jgi:2-iminobutanoate/2-iminopropanoate deaminase